MKTKEKWRYQGRMTESQKVVKAVVYFVKRDA